MYICQVCGTKLEDVSKFCHVCGTAVPRHAQSNHWNLKKCDCCKKLIQSPQVPQIRSLNNVQFRLCFDCSNHIDTLYNRPFLSEKERFAEEAWAKQKLDSGTILPEKQEAFRQIVNRFNLSDNKPDFPSDDNIHAYGSPWTIVAKMVCFFWVIAAIIGGGVIGKFLTGEDGAILIGGMIGLIVGLIMVSGIMMLVQIADDIANSRLYLKYIYKYLSKK